MQTKHDHLTVQLNSANLQSYVYGTMRIHFALHLCLTIPRVCLSLPKI